MPKTLPSHIFSTIILIFVGFFDLHSQTVICAPQDFVAQNYGIFPASSPPFYPQAISSLSNPVATMTVCQGDVVEFTWAGYGDDPLHYLISKNTVSQPVVPANSTLPALGWVVENPNNPTTCYGSWKVEFDTPGSYWLTYVESVAYGSCVTPNNTALYDRFINIIVTPALNDASYTICEGQSVSITPSGCGLDANNLITATETWAIGGTVVGVGGSITVAPTTTTTYTYTSDRVNDWDATTYYTNQNNYTVTVVPSPAISLVAPPSGCTGEVLQLLNYNTSSTYSFSVIANGSTYSNGIVSNILADGSFIPNFPSQAVGGGTLNISVTDVNGCTNNVSYPFVGCCTRPGLINYSNPVASVDFNTGQISSQSITINGVFLIDQNVSINNSTIYLAKDARIELASGITLDINNSILQACDGLNMWEGIVMTQGSTLEANLSTLMEAKIAINSINGAHYEIIDCDFLNSYRGIRVGPYSGAHTGYYQGCLFEVNSTLLQPHHLGTPSTKGIEVDRVANIYLGRGGCSEGRYYSRFINLRKGIHSNRSNVFLWYNRFVNNENGVYAEGEYGRLGQFGTTYSVNALHNDPITCGGTAIPTYPIGCQGSSQGSQFNVFDNCQVGIRTLRNISLYIDESTFFECDEGIVCSGNNKTTDIEVQVSSFYDTPMGINLTNNKGSNVKIRANCFQLTSPNGLGSKAIAVQEFIVPVTQSQVWVSGNYLSNYGEGISLINLRGALIDNNRILPVPDFWNTPTHGIRGYYCPECEITGNEVTGNDANIWSTHGIAMDFSPDALVQINCVSNLGRGLWVGGASSGIKVFNNSMENHRVGFFLNWGFTGPMIRYYNTGSSVLLIPQDNTFKGNFYSQLHSYYSYGNFSPWLFRNTNEFTPYHFYLGMVSTSFILSAIPINQSSIQENFYGFPCAEYERITMDDANTQIDNEIVATISDTASIQTWTPDEASMWFLNELNLMREITQDTTNFHGDSLLTNFLNLSLGTDLENITNLEDIINESEASGDLAAFAAAYAILQNFNSIELPAIQTKKFYDMMTPIFEQDSGDYNLEDYGYVIDSLTVWASKCPYVYGNTVYQSRVLLSLNDRPWTGSECEVSYDNGFYKTTNQLNGTLSLQLNIFPNPSTSSVNIQVPEDIEVFGLEVFEITGRQVHFSHEKQDIGYVKLDVSNWASGIYIVRLSSGSELYSGYLSVQY